MLYNLGIPIRMYLFAGLESGLYLWLVKHEAGLINTPLDFHLLLTREPLAPQETAPLTSFGQLFPLLFLPWILPSM